MILKAGAVILSSVDKRKIALLYRGKEKDWSFPKGHIEAGENLKETMIREVQEETGLKVDILQELQNFKFFSPREGDVFLKMFLVLSKDDSLLKLEYAGDKIMWIDLEKIIEKLSYDNLKEYFRSVYPTVKNVINSE